MRKKLALLLAAAIPLLLLVPFAPQAAARPGQVNGNWIIAGAGDITQPPNHSAATKAILASITGLDKVYTVGDNTPDGTLAEFNGAFNATWGAYKTSPGIRPAPGNHDWKTANLAGYKGYFGSAAGTSTQSWYSYNLGNWHIISLDSNCNTIGGCSTTSPEGKWLAADLANNHSSCEIVYDHRPRFSPGEHGNWSGFQTFWSMLANDGVDIMISGHDGLYARFAVINPAGTAVVTTANTGTKGIRQFVTGTGGGTLDTALTTKPATLQSYVLKHDGVTKFVLKGAGYDWAYLGVTPGTSSPITVLDSGSQALPTCTAP